MLLELRIGAVRLHHAGLGGRLRAVLLLPGGIGCVGDGAIEPGRQPLFHPIDHRFLCTDGQEYADVVIGGEESDQCAFVFHVLTSHVVYYHATLSHRFVLYCRWLSSPASPGEDGFR